MGQSIGYKMVAILNIDEKKTLHENILLNQRPMENIVLVFQHLKNKLNEY